MTKCLKFLTTSHRYESFIVKHIHSVQLRSVVLLGFVIFCCSCSGAQRDQVTITQLESVKETIRFDSKGDTLEGELLLPVLSSIEKKQVPLVVFVHGSGRATRQDYKGIAERLTREGYATFRYDKRGVGNSGGTFQEVGNHNSDRIKLLAEDASSAIQAMLGQEWLDKQKIILVGGSQAGWIIPVVCSMSPVYAAVCLSGPTVSVGEEIFYSDLAEHGSYSQQDADRMLVTFGGTKGFDNISYVSKLTQPSLWVFGTSDVSIPVKECIRRLDSARKASRLPVEIKVYEGADHGLYDTVTRRPVDVVSYVITWLKKLRQ